MALLDDRAQWQQQRTGLVTEAWARLHRLYDAVAGTWLVRGYFEAEAGDLAAIIAFRGLVALVPTVLLVVAVAGLFLRQERVMETAILASIWALPPSGARDALDAVLTARRESAWFGFSSAVGFVWIGTSFVTALARGMNRVYGVPNRHVVHQRLRAFAIVVVFAALFVVATLAAAVPTFFVNRRLGAYFESWTLASWQGQVISYSLALIAATVLFGVLYRAIPNAGQRLDDVWPGSLVGATLFVAMTQAFPLYIRVYGQANRFGAVFGLIWLLVTWFYVLAHVLLFGTYVNATYQRHRRARCSRDERPASQGRV
jgi:membrane protein